MSETDVHLVMMEDATTSVPSLKVTRKADVALDKEEKVKEEISKDSSADSDDTAVFVNNSGGNDKKKVAVIVHAVSNMAAASSPRHVPRHVALTSEDISAVSAVSKSASVGAAPSRARRVTFPGAAAFSAKTDSDASESDIVENVTTVDADVLDPSIPLGIGPSADDPYSPHHHADVDADLAVQLRTHAVDVCVEVKGLARMPLRHARAHFVVLFGRGPAPNTWRELGRTEAVTDPRGSHRWVQKLRIAAATAPDRSETVSLAVFEDGATAAAARTPTAGPSGALASCRVAVASLLRAPVRSLDVELASPRTGRVRGVARLAADLVPHVAFDERIAIDVAFAADAPARNRVLFVVSRSLPRGRWTPVYRSEVRTRDDLANFTSAEMFKRDLNAGNDRRLIRIEFYRFYKNLTCTLLGFCQTSVLSLRTCPINAGLYWWPAVDGISNAKVVLTTRNETEDSSSYSLRVVPTSFMSLQQNSGA
eukprot:IDg7856t1